MWRDLLDTLEGIDDDVVDDISPQHDIAPCGHPLPFVGCAKPPGFQDVLQMAVLGLNRAPA